VIFDRGRKQRSERVGGWAPPNNPSPPLGMGNQILVPEDDRQRRLENENIILCRGYAVVGGSTNLSPNERRRQAWQGDCHRKKDSAGNRTGANTQKEKAKGNVQQQKGDPNGSKSDPESSTI